MAKTCYKLDTIGCDNKVYIKYACSSSPIQILSSDHCGNVWPHDVEGTFTKYNASSISISISVVPCAECGGNCCTLNNSPCDCLNGNCVPATTYNTPGKYATIAACESGCAKNSNCIGECVDPTEIANLSQAINNLQSKICK
jgi:hypothetical protein